MRSRLLPLAVVAPACALFLVPSPEVARGCAVALPRGGYQVDVNAEQAVIVWDAATKTEHFIRAASFTSTSADFGFLVPTPTKPDLAEADAGVFDTLGRMTAARTEYVRQVVEIDGAGGGGCLPSDAAPKSAAAGDAPPMAPAAKAGVEVLGKSRVGGYDAVSLKADDADELRKWLEKNGYDARAELTGWFKWYTDNKWVITAFKIAADGPNGPPAADVKTAPTRTAKSQAVRMTFKTERPFYPYREPADARASVAGGRPRTLKVFFASDARYAGALGTDAAGWPGRAVWSGELPEVSELRPTGVRADAGRPWRMTEFVDESSPRPGTDEVYFSKSDDQGTLERPPVIVPITEYRQRTRGWRYELVAAAVGAPILALLVGLTVWRLVRRRV